jgi:hypothetical protein
MRVRDLLALLIFSFVVFLLAYPFIAKDGTGTLYLQKEMMPIHSSLTILRPQFVIPDLDENKDSDKDKDKDKPKKLKAVSYKEYLKFNKLPMSEVMQEDQITRIAEKDGYDSCMEALKNYGKHGQKMASEIKGFYKAPVPLPMAGVAAGIFFIVGVVVLGVTPLLKRR